MRKIIALFALTLFQFSAFAQSEVEMADTLRSEGKIYVVVAIMLIIFAGLITYLFIMDRKVSRLEKRVLDKEQKR